MSIGWITIASIPFPTLKECFRECPFIHSPRMQPIFDMKTVMCFGDSNTWGATPVPGNRYDRYTRWPGALQKELGENYYVIEEGLPGRNTVWDDPVDGDRNGLNHLVPLIYSHTPLDLLIILLGTNDLKVRFSVSATDIALSLVRLVRVARQCDHPLMGPAPEVLVVVPPPLKDLQDQVSRNILCGGLEKSRRLAAELKPLSEAHRFRMLDAGETIECSPVDGIHWESEAHLKLAHKLSEVVEEMLGE